MSKKKAFALRINEEMLKAIEKWASDEFRSTNGQIEWILMQQLKEHNREPKKQKKSDFKKVAFFIPIYFGILQHLKKYRTCNKLQFLQTIRLFLDS